MKKIVKPVEFIKIYSSSTHKYIILQKKLRIVTLYTKRLFYEVNDIYNQCIFEKKRINNVSIESDEFNKTFFFSIKN